MAQPGSPRCPRLGSVATDSCLEPALRLHPPSRGLGTSRGGAPGVESPGGLGGGGGGVLPNFLLARRQSKSPVTSPSGGTRPCIPCPEATGMGASSQGQGAGRGGDGWRGRGGKLLDGKMPGLILDVGSRYLHPPRSHIQSPPAWCPGQPRPKGSASDVPQFPFSPVI